tara:strand:- start:354 stop:770 length:417 start_codon:yes stop_codon:yes gene_type:complete
MVVDTPAGGPASHGAIGGGIAALSSAGLDMDADAGAMLAALDRYRRGQRRLDGQGGYEGGVSDAELAHHMRGNLRQHIGGAGSDAAAGTQLGTFDSIFRSQLGRGMSDDEMQNIFGRDPNAVRQTRRAVRRQTQQPQQ